MITTLTRYTVAAAVRRDRAAAAAFWWWVKSSQSDEEDTFRRRRRNIVQNLQIPWSAVRMAGNQDKDAKGQSFNTSWYKTWYKKNPTIPLQKFFLPPSPRLPPPQGTQNSHTAQFVIKMCFSNHVLWKQDWFSNTDTLTYPPSTQWPPLAPTATESKIFSKTKQAQQGAVMQLTKMAISSTSSQRKC